MKCIIAMELLHTITQFESAKSYVTLLSTGEIDGYGYDYDLVGQHSGLGFGNLMGWAKKAAIVK